MPALSASELEKLRQQKTIYANIFIQQQLYNAGVIPKIRYQNTSHLDNTTVLSGFTGGGSSLNNTTTNNITKTNSVADLVKITSIISNIKIKNTTAASITSISFNVLTPYSANLSSSWVITKSTAVTVRYYSATTSSGSRTLIGIQNKSAGITSDILAAYTPVAGFYYFIGVTPIGVSEALSSAMFMPFPDPTGIVINDLTYTSASLSSSWIQIPASNVTVNYYVTTSVYPSNGTQVGTSQSATSSQFSNTLSGYTPVAGSFYYVGVTPTNGTESFSPIAIQMPYPLVSSVSLGNLTNTSSSLSSTWTILPTTALVTVKYYSTNSTSSTAGTQVATTQSPTSGIFNNTVSFSLVPGTYYYVGVTGPSGSELVSSLATMMPYPIASGVSIGSLGNSATSLSATWSVTPASQVTVNYYSRSTAGTTGGTLVASQTIASGTLVATYAYTPASGTFYYAGVVPSGGSEVFSSSSTQMPVAVASGVTLNALVKSSTVLGGSWTVVNASQVTVKYYDNGTTNSTSGGTQIGTSQLVASGTTTNILPGTYTLTSGRYFYIGVTPIGGSEVLSSVATQKNPAIAYSVALGALSDSSTTLSATWALDAASGVTVKYYSNASNSTSGGTQVGTSQTIGLGTYSNTLSSFTPVPGTYYYVGVTPTAGSETLSLLATLMTAATASNVRLGSLTASSSGLTSSWALTSRQPVSVQYYYNTTNSITVAGATAVGSAQSVAAGTTVNSLTIPLLVGKYYFVGVTPSGGTQVTSALPTTQMPVPLASGVSLAALTSSSIGLSSGWTVSPDSDVSVQYYSTNSTSVPASGGTTVGSAQSVTSGIVTNTLTTTLTAGTYYYVGVTPTGGSEVRSSTAVQMPYATASSVVLGAIDPSATGFTVTWAVSSASAVTVRFYSTSSASIPASKTQVGGNQAVLSGTTSLTVSWSTLGYTGVAGTYYFVGVTPTNGIEVFSSSASKFPNASSGTVQLTNLTHSSTNLSSSWGVSPASQVTVKYYQYKNSGQDNTVVGTVTVASGTTTNTFSYNPITGYYYAVGVTPTGGSETISSRVLKSTNFTSIILNSLTNSSTTLSGTWSADTAVPQTIYFYKNASNSTSGGTLINTGGTAVAQQNASITYTYTPESGLYYYMGVSATGASEILYSSTQLLAATTVSAVTMTTLVVSSTNIQASWSVAHKTAVTVNFYTSASSTTTSTGTFETQTIAAGITTVTSVNAPTRGTYYFIGVTPTAGSEVKSAAAIQMPLIVASSVTLGALTFTSTSLSSSWSVTTDTDVTVKYYTTNSTTVPASGRLQLGTSATVASGTTTHTFNASPPVSPAYYYVGVTPAGGVEVFSASARLMPGSGAFEQNVAVYLTAIDSSHFSGSSWLDLASGQSIAMTALAYNTSVLGVVPTGKAVKLLGSASNYGTKTNSVVPFDITGGFSYEMWFFYKVASVGAIAQSIIFESGYTNTNGIFMNGAGNITAWSANPGGGRTDTNSGTYTKTSTYSTSGQAFQIPINQWIHIVTTVSSTATRIYINSELIAENTYSTSITQQGSTNSMILGDANISESYVGKAKVYTTPLTASLITANFIADYQYFGVTVGKVPTLKYSAQFNGSNYLTVPQSSAFTFGTNSHTIEFWLYQTSRGSYDGAWSYSAGVSNNQTNYYNLGLGSSPGILLGNGSGWGVSMSWSAASLNAWHHYALVRNGTAFTMYVDGSSVATATYAGSISAQAGTMVIGGDYSKTILLSNSSYMTNVRVVNGTAMYTSNFTPPTSPLTPVSGTQLLIQGLVDNSQLGFTVTNVGTVTQSVSQSPFA